jgi:hypothetical protein
VILSTINRDGTCRQFVDVGSIRSRSNGASVGSLVNGQTVIEAVASKRSSWMIANGTGLARAVAASRDGPELAALHASRPTEIASTNAWSSAACTLVATRRA